MAAPSKSRKPVAPRPARPFSLPAWALLGSLAIATLVVHRHVLHAYFALDDFVMFQQATGVRSWPLTAWRWLSGWAWFRAVVPFFGTDAHAYHTVSLLLHVANALLISRVATRWGASPAAAWLAAGWFALSRLHFPALLAATSIGELLSLTFLLGALLASTPPTPASERTSPLPWPAMLAMALAVSAKESVMLVPCAAVALALASRPASAPSESGAPATDTWLARVRPLLPTIATWVVLGALFLASGMGSGRLGGEAYAVSFGANLFENLARLAGWSVDLWDPIPDLYRGTPGLATFLVPALAIAVTALIGFRGSALARAGAAWWWLAVLPVLPLPGRTYLHYLYVPLAGLALVLGALFDAWARRGGSRAGRRTWAVATAVLLAYGAWSDVLLTMRMDVRMATTDWPLDPVLRKSEIAHRAIGDVQQHLAGRHANVAILIPASISHAVNVSSGRVEADSVVRRYALREVLDEGRSLKAMVRNVDSVAFVHDYEPGRVGWECYVSQGDSHVVPLGPLPAAHAQFVRALLSVGLVEPARDYAVKALAGEPGDADLRALLDALPPPAPR